MRLLLLFSLILLILAWLRGRPKGVFFPSDSFILCIIIFLGITPLINPLAASSAKGQLIFTDVTAQHTMFGLSLAFLVCAGCWMLRPAMDGREFITSTRALLGGKTAKLATRQALYGFLLLFGLILLSYISIEFFMFKLRVFEFMTGNLSDADYAYARRIEFLDAGLGMKLADRSRFALIPLLFVLASYFLIRKFPALLAFGIVALLFILGPASLSKLPMIFFLVYFALTYMILTKWTRYLNFRYLVIVIPASFLFIFIILVGIYYLQYSSNYSLSDIGSVFQLAFYRLFTATYAGMLAHFKIYPDFFPYTGISSISLIGGFFGESRNVDTEVAQHFLGYSRARFTSFPTAYIGNAYASFGYSGIVIFSIIISTYLVFIDKLILTLRNPLLKLATYVTMVLNSVFFALLAAPTVLLTYGLFVIPMLCLIADRMTGRGRRRRGPLRQQKRPIPPSLR